MIIRRRKPAKMGLRVEDRICFPHRKWIRGCMCAVPGCEQGPIQAAHVRTGTEGGTGIKPHDRWLIPLCHAHHKEQHDIGEPAFERKHGLDMKAVAVAHAKASPHRLKWERTQDE